MRNKIKMRLATEEDSSSILKIYAPFVTDTSVTFEYEVPSEIEFEDRIKSIQKKYPWIVCEINNDIVGYAYASPFNERTAYDWSVDLSIYVNPEYHGRKIGKALYYALIEILKLQGFYNAVSLVTIPNKKSEILHKSFGFKEIGIYKNIGYKFNSWYDVKWYGLKIREHDTIPKKIKSMNMIFSTGEFKSIINKSEEIVKL